MNEGIPQYAGFVVLSMTDVPLGFGRAAHTTEGAKELDPVAICVLHQADIGEFLRVEDTLAALLSRDLLHAAPWMVTAARTAGYQTSARAQHERAAKRCPLLRARDGLVL
jgi:hypothetical protein